MITVICENSARKAGMSPTNDKPPRFDSSRPSPARIYDYLLGGKDNFEVDRQASEQLKATLGDVVTHGIVWENRRFLQRAVRFLAESGIDQFIDLGAGLPAQGNVHQVAQEINPDVRVIYVDYDPIVLSHGRAILATNSTTSVINVDVRDPQGILDHPDTRALIDFSRPVALLAIAVLHFIADSDDPAGILTHFRRQMVPGSFISLSHLTTDGPSAEECDQVVEVFKKASISTALRSREAIQGFFDGTELVDPGFVRPWQWRPYGAVSPRTNWLYAAVGQIPAT